MQFGIMAGIFDGLFWIVTPQNWPIVLAVVGGLGFVIFVHELGHFLVAKWCGVKCEKFYLGFDPGGLKICSVRYGETEYGIGVIPFGGYVKMLGQDDNPANMADEGARSRGEPAEPHVPHGDIPAEPTAESPVVHDPRSYLAKTVPQRMAIISAGVIMNLIFAYIMAAMAFGLGVEDTACIVGATVPGTTAWKHALPRGAEFVEVGGKPSEVFSDLKTSVSLNKAQQELNAKLRYPGETELHSVTLHPRSEPGALGQTIGVVPMHRLELYDELAASTHSAAARATPAFEGGDKIVAVDGQPVGTMAEFDAACIRLASQPLKITVERTKGSKDGKPAPVDVTVPPQPRRDLGMAMLMGPIAAVQEGSPADLAGLKVDDRLETIDGAPVGDPLTLAERLRRRAGETVTLGVVRALNTDRKESSPATPEPVKVRLQAADWQDPQFPVAPLSLPSLGVAVRVLTEITAIEPGGPADKAGLRVGETIVSAKILKPTSPTKNELQAFKESTTIFVDESPAKEQSWAFFQDMLLESLNPTCPVELSVRTAQGHQTRSVKLEPRDSAERFDPDRGWILPTVSVMQKAHSLGDAFRLGSTKATDAIFLVYRVLQRLGDGTLPVSSAGGPIEIFRQAGHAAQAGMSSFLLFFTMLSANLAVINFLPIPVLDGGHMVFLMLEGIFRKPVSERVMIAFQYAGLLFILGLMLMVTVFDVGRLLGS